jgi:dUTP pyrophosphatase
MLAVKRLSALAQLPKRASEGAAGYDLSSAGNYIVKKRGKERIKTDLQVFLPEGTYGRIAPRSGLAWKNGIDVGAGVIDIDYEGNVGVILFNHSDEDFKIQIGDRIAQLILEKYLAVPVVDVENLAQKANDQKADASRGAKGFGSTGK